MGRGKLTEHAQNLQGCKKYNLRKAIVDAPSRTSWSPLRTKTSWSAKVMPSTGINVGNSHMMMNT